MKVKTNVKAGGLLGIGIVAVVIVDLNLLGGGCCRQTCGGGCN
jgi:hypothetical protein